MRKRKQQLQTGSADPQLIQLRRELKTGKTNGQLMVKYGLTATKLKKRLHELVERGLLSHEELDARARIYRHRWRRSTVFSEVQRLPRILAVILAGLALLLFISAYQGIVAGEFPFFRLVGALASAGAAAFVALKRVVTEVRTDGLYLMVGWGEGQFERFLVWEDLEHVRHELYTPQKGRPIIGTDGSTYRFGTLGHVVFTLADGGELRVGTREPERFIQAVKSVWSQEARRPREESVDELLTMREPAAGPPLRPQLPKRSRILRGRATGAARQQRPRMTRTTLAAAGAVVVTMVLGVVLFQGWGGKQIERQAPLVSSTPRTRSTPFKRLVSAVKSGNVNKTAAVLNQGAPVNKRTREGLTPLMYACRRCNLPVAAVLLDWGADVNASGRNGLTPLMFAGHQGCSKLCRLLVDRGAHVNAASTHGITPLMFAVHKGHEKTVTFLLQREADPNVRGKKGETALSVAQAQGRRNIARMLTAARAFSD